MNNWSFRRNALSVAVALTGLTPMASVQASEAFTLEEIVVTAQKREQNLQDIGIAINAFDGKTLEAMGVVNSNEIAAKTPNLNIVSPGGDGGVVSVFIRGIGLNDFAVNNTGPVGFYVDNVSTGSSNAQTTTLFDVERVEILKGPQGTLFGRNTTGGALNIISNKPTDEFEATVKASVGNYGFVKTEGVVSGSLTDTLNGRVALVGYKSDGFIENLSTGDEVEKKNFAGRILLDYLPTDELSFLLNLHGSRNDSDNELFGRTDDADFFEGRHGTEDYRINVDTFGASLTTTYDLSDDIVLTSVTSYDDLDKRQREEGDMSELELVENTTDVDSHTFTQELRLNGSTDRINWIAGLYYLSENISWDYDFRANDLPLLTPEEFVGIGLDLGFIDPMDAAATLTLLGTDPLAFFGESEGHGHQELTTQAVFGQVEYELNEQWTLTVGGRYTQLEVDIDYAIDIPSFATLGSITEAATFSAPGSLSFLNNQDSFDFQDDLTNEEFSGKIALNYYPNSDQLYYGSITRGFKGGGFNGGLVSDLANYASTAEYDPEILTAYELGLKHTLLDGTMRLNASLFYYDYEDAQVFNSVSDPNTGLLQNQIENAKSLELYGADIDLIWMPTEPLFIQLGVGYTHSEFEDYELTIPTTSGTAGVDVSGETPQNTPEWNVSLLANYTWVLDEGGSVAAQIDGSYQSEVFFSNGTFETIGDPDTYTRNEDVGQSSYTLWNARLSWVDASEQLEVALWGKNLGDKEYATYRFELTDLVGADQVLRGTPRTYGVDVKYSF